MSQLTVLIIGASAGDRARARRRAKLQQRQVIAALTGQGFAGKVSAKVLGGGS